MADRESFLMWLQHAPSREACLARWPFALLVLLSLGLSLRADPPVASYVFPPGGQRGKAVTVKVGGLYLYDSCPWELLGPGVKTSPRLARIPTLWFEGPLLPLPASQRAEDYPQDMRGEVQVAADAPLGTRRLRLWTSEGAASGSVFVVGELPEVVETETEGDAVPVPVKLPVTINGRIFPREDVDVWSFPARKGEVIACEVHASRIGSPLDARLEVRDPTGRVIADNDDSRGTDPLVAFTAPTEGTYRVHITDANRLGGQTFVYRLTLTSGPFIERVHPLGGRRGQVVRLEATGPGVPAAPIALTLPRDAPSNWTTRLPVAGRPSNPIALDLDDLPEYQEGAPAITGPAVLNGRVGKPGEVDNWTIRAQKGKELSIELRARQLGSPLHGVIEMMDSKGKSLARAEATTADPVLTFRPPADGEYTLRIRDRFRSRGGPAFSYRLRLTHPTPSFTLTLASDVLTVPRGGDGKLIVKVQRRGGATGPIALQAEGLPAGVSLVTKTIPANAPQANLIFRGTATASVSQGRVRLRGSTMVGGKAVAGSGQEGDNLLVGVGLKAPFKVVGTYDLRMAPRGGVFPKPFRIQRNGYTGTLEVRLADRQARHLQGVTGPVLAIPADKSEFVYPVLLPPWMELGRTSRACVMVVGKVTVDGREHTVSYTSQAQADQIIAVVESGRLGLEAERTSVAVRPGEAVTLRARVRRAPELKGPVTLELVLPVHARGVKAAVVTVPAGKDEAAMVLQFDRQAGPFNAPAVLRATLRDRGQPVMAEVALELVPPAGGKQ